MRVEACVKIREAQGGCAVGQAVITSAGKLPARYVIHTVGPVWSGDKAEKERLLRECYVNSLRLAREHGVKTIAFPNISTGIYHFPKPRAADIALGAVRGFEDIDAFEKIVFVCYDLENHALYQKLV